MFWNFPPRHDDSCCHVLFAFLIYGNGLTSFVHDLNTRNNPFHVSEYPWMYLNLKNLVWYNNILLWKFPQERMVVAASMFYLPWSYMASDWWAFSMMYIPASTPSRPQSSHGCTEILQPWHHTPTFCDETLLVDMMIAAVIFHLPCGCMVMDWYKSSTWSQGLYQPLLGPRVAMDEQKYCNPGIILHLYYVVKRCL